MRCRMDDILIRIGPHEHLQVLEEVLTRLEKHGILAKRSKCEFMVLGVEFLGYHVDREGRHPTDEKIAAIKGALSPKNVAELHSYLGLLSYYGNFIPSLGLVDSHSNWIEVAHMTSTSTKSTIDQTVKLLRVWFAACGLPEEVVSDNSPQFIASEFVDFLKQNGDKQTLVPPYHPSSNGAAERTVQILKQALQEEAERVRRGVRKWSLKHQLATCLFQYRNTPHSVTRVTPAELFLKHKPHTKFSVLKPNMEMHIQNQQGKLQQQHNNSCVKMCELSSRDSVNVRNTRGGVEKWVPGTVIRRLGSLTYLVKVGRQLRYVHVDHLVRTERENSEEVLDEGDFDEMFREERAVPMLSSKLTSGTSTSPSAATSVPEPETESPCKVPMQTPKPVAVQASVLKDKTPNCVSAQPSTLKIQTQTPIAARKSACKLQSPNPVPALKLDSPSRAQSPNMSTSRDLPNRTEHRYPVRHRKAPVKLNL